MRSQSLRDRAAAVVLPGLRHPNRTVCLGINTSVGVARRPMIELKLETNLKRMKLTHVCADDLRTRLRTIRGTVNEQSNKTMNVGNRGEQRMHECLCRLRDQKMRVHNITTNVSCLCSSDTGTNVPEPLQTLWIDIAHIGTHTCTQQTHANAPEYDHYSPRGSIESLPKSLCCERTRRRVAIASAEHTDRHNPQNAPSFKYHNQS